MNQNDDDKSRLNVLCQRQWNMPPSYRSVQTGRDIRPPYSPIWESTCTLPSGQSFSVDNVAGPAKYAEQKAAMLAIDFLTRKSNFYVATRRDEHTKARRYEEKISNSHFLSHEKIATSTGRTPVRMMTTPVKSMPYPCAGDDDHIKNAMDLLNSIEPRFRSNEEIAIETDNIKLMSQLSEIMEGAMILYRNAESEYIKLQLNS